MTPRSIRISAVLAVAALSLAACGDDDDASGGDADAFCTTLAELADAPDGGDEENLALLREVGESAPSEISDEWDALVTGFETLQNLDTATEDDIADFEVALAEFDEANVAIEAYALENCPDLPPEFFSTE